MAKDRKWRLAKTGVIVAIVVLVAGCVLPFVRPEAAAATQMLVTGAGLFTLVFGGYAAANVAQKQVIGKNYRPELAETEPRPEHHQG